MEPQEMATAMQMIGTKNNSFRCIPTAIYLTDCQDSQVAAVTEEYWSWVLQTRMTVPASSNSNLAE
jgi:hypothetical protein